VPALRRPHGLGQQVAADLPDVLHHLQGDEAKGCWIKSRTGRVGHMLC
jgi:hypothetical protein